VAISTCSAVRHRPELIARVASLEAARRQLAAERDARAAEASHAQRRIRELEDELTAARESLRRVIRILSPAFDHGLELQ